MSLEELEKRIGVLEDIEAIKKLHREYVYALAGVRQLELPVGDN